MDRKQITDRIESLTADLAALRQELAKVPLRFKVGDAVYVRGFIGVADQDDPIDSYRVIFGDESGNWFGEGDLIPSPEGK